MSRSSSTCAPVRVVPAGLHRPLDGGGRRDAAVPSPAGTDGHRRGAAGDRARLRALAATFPRETACRRATFLARPAGRAVVRRQGSDGGPGHRARRRGGPSSAAPHGIRCAAARRRAAGGSHARRGGRRRARLHAEGLHAVGTGLRDRGGEVDQVHVEGPLPLAGEAGALLARSLRHRLREGPERQADGDAEPDDPAQLQGRHANARQGDEHGRRHDGLARHRPEPQGRAERELRARAPGAVHARGRRPGGQPELHPDRRRADRARVHRVDRRSRQRQSLLRRRRPRHDRAVSRSWRRHEAGLRFHRRVRHAAALRPARGRERDRPGHRRHLPASRHRPAEHRRAPDHPAAAGVLLSRRLGHSGRGDDPDHGRRDHRAVGLRPDVRDRGPAPRHLRARRLLRHDGSRPVQHRDRQVREVADRLSRSARCGSSASS